MRIAKTLVAILVAFSAASLAVVAASADDDSSSRAKARIEIHQLTTTYGWSIDAKEIDALMSIFVEGEPGVDEIYPVYDLSPLQIPGLEKVEGTTAIRGFLAFAVAAGEPWSFSSISNVDIEFTGPDTAVGGDYYIHDGWVPAELDSNGEVVRTYSQFNPGSYDLLCDPQYLVHKRYLGQHLYEFVKNDENEWKIHVFVSSPTYVSAGDVASVDQISPAKKPWHPMFDALGNCGP
jgi:hypothetical protein